MMPMASGLRIVIMRRHYPIEVMLVCVRWYAAYPQSLRHIEEMTAESDVSVNHATIRPWAVKPCQYWPRPSETLGAWQARVGAWTKPKSLSVDIGGTCIELSTA